MSLDLNKLENKLDEALSNETSQTLTKFLDDKRMTNNKQQTEMKLYTEEQLLNTVEAIKNYYENNPDTAQEMIKKHLINLAPIELPSDEEIEEKLNVAYGNGYEQGEMDFYKKMQGKGNQYADGYAEGYKRAMELVEWGITNLIPPHNESNIRI